MRRPAALALALAACTAADERDDTDAPSGADTESPAAAHTDAPDTDSGPPDTVPPTIVGVFPPSWVGVGETASVLVRASDDVGVASVTVAGVRATLDPRGFWIARGVPSADARIEVRDAAGHVARKDISLHPSPPWTPPMQRLAAMADGAVVALAEDTLLRFHPDESPRTTVLSSPSRGKGPSWGRVGMLAVDGDTVYVSAGPDVYAVDTTTGDRTLANHCDVLPTGFVITTSPLELWFTTDRKLVRCSIGESTPTEVADLPFWGGSGVHSAWDPVHHRLVFADGTYGNVAAWDLTFAASSELVAGEVGRGVYGLVVRDGEILFVDERRELRRVKRTGGAETLATTGGDGDTAAMALCGATRDVCVQAVRPDRMYRVVDTGTRWTADLLAPELQVGTPAPVRDPFRGETAFSALPFVVPGSDPFHPDVRFVSVDWTGATSGVLWIDDTGARSRLLDTRAFAVSRPLASGTQVLVGYDGVFRVDAHTLPLTTTPVPGTIPGLAGYSANFDLAPADTLLSGEEALVYVDRSGLRVHGLTSGDDRSLAATPAGPWSVVADDDGTVVLLTYPNALWRLAPFAPAPTPWRELDGYSGSLAFSPETGTIYFGYPLPDAYDGTGPRIAHGTPTVDVPDLVDPQPGPWPRSVVAWSDARAAVVLFDVPTGAAWVLAQ